MAILLTIIRAMLLFVTIMSVAHLTAKIAYQYRTNSYDFAVPASLITLLALTYGVL